MPENLREIEKNWDEFAKKDPLWSILPLPEKRGNRWKIEELLATGQTEVRMVMEYIKRLGLPLDRHRALDFGCGVGRLTQALCAYFDECVGLDISEHMLQLARQHNRCPDRCSYVANQTADLRIFNSASFDFVYSNIVFQHMAPVYTRGYVKEFIRIMKPGGIIVFQVATKEVGAGTKLKSKVLRIVPRLARQAYKRLKFGTWAIKDMYCINEEELNKLILTSGAKIIDVTEDRSLLPRYEGRRYCVTKPDRYS